MHQAGAMEVGETPAVVLKNPPPNPKTIIYQKYGQNAKYTMKEVLESVQNGCPGLPLQKGPCLYVCTLELPELSITSEPFKRKKDAMQAVSKLAIEKLGIQTAKSNLTVPEACDELISRVSYLFSDEFLSSLHPLTGSSLHPLTGSSLRPLNGPTLHPLTGHFRESLERGGHLHGLLPVPVLSACDSKLHSLCKFINPKAESNILLSIALIMRAARSCSSVAISEEKLLIWRQTPYSQEARQALLDQNVFSVEDIVVEALYVPCSVGNPIEPIYLNVSSNQYYLDVIAQKLGLPDSSHVLVSRTFGKASSEMRFYFSAPNISLELDSTSNLSNAKETGYPDATLNARACYLSGQDIHGDAILASIGYTRRSTGFLHESISVGTYYRMLVGRLPDGGYKLSREAILAADLPLAFTNRSNWRGSSPRDLLCAFCRQNWLSEPEFSTVSIDDSAQSSKIPETCKKLKVSEPSKEVHENGVIRDANDVESAIKGGTFMCEVKMLSRNQELILEYKLQGSFRRQNDAIQNAALRVLSWLNEYFKQPNVSIEKWSSSRDGGGIHVYPQKLNKELALCLSVHNVQQNSVLQRCTSLGSKCTDELSEQNGLSSVIITGPDSANYPANGSLACICYSIYLKQKGEPMKQVLESCDEFEFEIGTGAVTPLLEACVTQMSVNQFAFFISELPPQHSILAAAGSFAKSLSLLSLQDCCLEYSVNLVRVTEPLEDRMEQALFNPPLSKQRVEYALKHINESGATTLVDFGCGSGSLLESLMNYPTSLKTIAGVDISRKGLTRAAKVIHSKLTASSELISNTSIKSVVLYDGSITVFDHRLHGFDIGTCLEVIEHMEEDQACMFGDVVLGSFCPKILIVSTPNYEYNPILQKCTQSSQDDKGDDKTETLTCKFRNYDHKFEWTRDQFNHWASDLASKYDYSVDFSGVGGSGDLDPGFASQIAIFRNNRFHPAVQFVSTAQCYEVIWEWDSTCMTTFTL
ncbi:hypothetical protein IFM89_001865 [Coptis chinensis]|uniref:Small RNA 2'-O-methyltransferase n=1 Tax=Coptis chinensis TaxID=261450 RepID=A0A835LQK7_9MAGN|nr:hypothetical protein IFM89_001865 [Coptis chinensis]